jgi:hypothetical protein
MLPRVVSPALASLLILTTRQCLPCGYTRGYTPDYIRYAPRLPRPRRYYSSFTYPQPRKDYPRRSSKSSSLESGLALPIDPHFI